jgi:hypothetical protein
MLMLMLMNVKRVWKKDEQTQNVRRVLNKDDHIQ